VRGYVPDIQREEDGTVIQEHPYVAKIRAISCGQGPE
jgi:hypothetical protein